jgi:hypothetical protein
MSLHDLGQREGVANMARRLSAFMERYLIGKSISCPLTGLFLEKLTIPSQSTCLPRC